MVRLGGRMLMFQNALAPFAAKAPDDGDEAFIGITHELPLQTTAFAHPP
jgi:hypothetical protein